MLVEAVEWGPSHFRFLPAQRQTQPATETRAQLMISLSLHEPVRSVTLCIHAQMYMHHPPVFKTHSWNGSRGIGWGGRHVCIRHHRSKLLSCTHQSLLDVQWRVKIFALLTLTAILGMQRQPWDSNYTIVKYVTIQRRKKSSNTIHYTCHCLNKLGLCTRLSVA